MWSPSSISFIVSSTIFDLASADSFAEDSTIEFVSFAGYSMLAFDSFAGDSTLEFDSTG